MTLQQTLPHALRIAALSALCAAAPGLAAAQSDAAGYPSRPITIVEPHTPGGLVDTFARAVAQQLSAKLGQPVVVENRPGASQAIGATAVARAKPDGYTLLLGTQAGLVFGYLAKKNPAFDPVKDFAPISGLFDTPFYLAVNSSVPAKSVAELIALAKAQPGKLTFASLGQGSAHHLAGEIFKTLTDTDILHVAYKGSAPAANDLLSGQIDMMFEGAASIMPHAKAGKLRLLGASTVKRTEAMPDLPTIAETVPGYDLTVWMGLVAPAGTPRPIIDKLNRAVGEILATREIRERFAPMGVEMMPTTPDELAARIRDELPQWSKAMRNAGIQPE